MCEPIPISSLSSPNSPSIQDVIFFPQMRPEASRQSAVDSPQSYIELGVPEEWIEPLQELGYDSIEKLAEVEKYTKLHQEMMGYRKKNKLEIETVSPEEVREWIEKSRQ